LYSAFKIGCHGFNFEPQWRTYTNKVMEIDLII